jgi:hypothetical protein
MNSSLLQKKHALHNHYHHYHHFHLRRIIPLGVVGVVENRARVIRPREARKAVKQPERVDLESLEKASPLSLRKENVIYKQSGLREG